jgi:hypothetical protein
MLLFYFCEAQVDYAQTCDHLENGEVLRGFPFCGSKRYTASYHTFVYRRMQEPLLSPFIRRYNRFLCLLG